MADEIRIVDNQQCQIACSFSSRSIITRATGQPNRFVSAVPLPNPASTSTVIGKKPSSDGPAIDITSKLSSAVVTGGGAQVTTSGSTSGAAAVTTKIEGPGVSSTITAVGQGGISGTSATAGDSASVQKGRSKTGERGARGREGQTTVGA